MHKDVKQRRVVFVLSTAVLAVVLLVGLAPTFTSASSHREAPLIANDPQADTTDVYAFVSPDVTNTVTLIGDWIPFESPYGGPNYFRFADEVLYELHVDNVGDARSHITYQFQFHTSTQNPNTFLYNTGPINSLTDPNWNVRQVYTVTEIVSDTVAITTTVLGGGLASPPVNIGSASTPNYGSLANAAIHTLSNAGDTIKVFAGQRDDPFFVDLGSVFDLLHLRGQPQLNANGPGYAPGPGNIPLDGLAGYNVHSIAIQIPISRLTKPGDSTIGVWATSKRHTTRVFGGGTVVDSGPAVQISRLGMPLVNEVVMPLALKDVFNSLDPKDDLTTYVGVPLLQKSVQDPELGSLLCGLYGVPLPRDTTPVDCHTEYTTPGTGRSDIFDIFLQGMKTAATFTITTPSGPVALPPNTNVNRPTSPSRQPSEVLRLNTAFRPGGAFCSPTPNYRLGLLGGDVCGFPNGRRLQDDVTDIEVLAVGGAAWGPLTGDTSFTFNGGLVPILRDNIFQNDVPFGSTFPYLASPHSGQYPAFAEVRNMFLSLIGR
jgi:hypothetical protein